MKYQRHKVISMKLLSWVTLGATIWCITSGMAFYAILLLLLSFHFSSEAEISRVRIEIDRLIRNQDILLRMITDDKNTKTHTNQ